MSDAATIRAGHAEVELGANLSQLASGLKTGQRYIADFAGQIAKIGASIAAAGAVVVAPFTAMAMSFTEAGSDLMKLSLQTGIAVETLSALGTFTNLDDLGGGIKKMQVFLADAANGGREANDTLARLGLTVAELGRLTPEQQLARFGDAVKGIANPAEKTAAIISIFGRNGLELAGLLNRGSDGMQQFIQRAREMGLVMSQEDAESAKKYKGEMKLLGAVMDSIKNTIGAAVVPVLRDLVGFQIELWTQANLWIRGNRELVTWLFRMGLAAVGVGAVLGGLAAGIYGVSVGVGVLATVVNATKLTWIGLKFVWNLMFIEAYGMIAIFGALAVVMGALIYVVLDFQGALDNINWTSLTRDAAASFAAISDAISAGNIATAIRIMWLQIRLWWTQGVNWISETWNNLWRGLQIIILNAVGSIIMAGINVVYDLVSAFMSLEPAVANIFTRVAGYVASVWHRMIGEVLGAWGDAQERMGLAGPGFGESFRTLGNTRANAATIGANATIENRNIGAWFDQQNLEVARENRLGIAGAAFGDEVNRLLREGADERNANAAGENAIRGDIQNEGIGAWFEARNAEVQRDMMAGLAGVGAGAELARRDEGSFVQGTFAAAAISGFLAGGSTAADRTAAAAEEQRDLMNRMVQLMIAQGRDPAALNIV